MFSFLGFGSGRSTTNDDDNVPGIDIPSVDICEIEEAPEKRARTVKHIFRANHINHSVLFHHLEFHNHAPHIIGSSYLLGATTDQLFAIYEKESEELEPWKDAPSEIAKYDWRDYLGKKEYQRAWVDFFEDQLVKLRYEWRQLVFNFLFEGPNPLINNLISGLGHPLIHLGYAFEFASPTVAIEALALAATCYDNQHVYLDHPSYTKPSPWTSDSPLEVLNKMNQDTRFASLNLDSPGSETLESISSNKAAEALMLEYWNALTVHNLPSQFEMGQRAMTALLIGSHTEGEKYDFFLVHLLTTSHALRILIPLLPKKYHVSLVRQWWLLVVKTYIAQQRPRIDPGRIYAVDLKGRDWKYIDDVAVNGKWRFDAHFVKALRAIKVVKETWGDEFLFELKAAVLFAESFDGWGGFGNMTESEVEAVGIQKDIAGRHGVKDGF